MLPNIPEQYKERLKQIREEAIALRASINKKMEAIANDFRQLEEDLGEAGKAQTFSDWQKTLYKSDPAFYIELEGILGFDEKAWAIADKLGRNVRDEAIENPEADKPDVFVAARQIASAAIGQTKKALTLVAQRNKRAAKKHKPGATVGFVEDLQFNGQNLLGQQAIVDEDLGDEVSLRFGNELITAPKTAIKALTKKQLTKQTETNTVTGEVAPSVLVEEVDRLKTELQAKDWEVEKLSEQICDLQENLQIVTEEAKQVAREDEAKKIIKLVMEELNAVFGNVVSLSSPVVDASRIREIIREVFDRLRQPQLVVA